MNEKTDRISRRGSYKEAPLLREEDTDPPMGILSLIVILFLLGIGLVVLFYSIISSWVLVK
jgi:hypothetical protein